MKFLLSVLLVAGASAIAELIFPWWIIAVVAFSASVFIEQKRKHAFFMGFIGIGLCWLVAALLHDSANEHILSTRMAALFKLPGYWLFLMLTVLIGALIGGLSSLAGVLITSRNH
jgi:hypothetical protein